MSLETLKEARQSIEDAQKTLRSEAKATITEELKALFADPTVMNITWAQKAGEYNDEGMYPGVFGPALNQFEEEDPRTVEESIREWTYDGSGYDVLYGNFAVEPRAKRLEEVLNTIGDEVLSNLYGDENVVVVLRTANGAKVITEYAGL